MRSTAKSLLATVILVIASAIGADAQCTGYGNSHADPGTPPYGAVCIGTGSGCTECITEWWGPGGGTFYSVCYYDFGGLYCYTWGSENQGL